MSSLPLEGKKVLITREQSQATSLAKQLIQVGATPVIVPLIAFRKLQLDPLIFESIPTYDWLLFTSQNGVTHFFQQFDHEQLSFLDKVKIAAVGTKTKEKLLQFIDKIDFVPKKFTGDDLAEELKKVCSRDEKILLVKGNLARNVIVKELSESGYDIQAVTVYETYLPIENKELLSQVLTNEKIDIITFTSPSTVEHFVQILGEDQIEQVLSGKVIACIGPITERKAKSYGIAVHVSPKTYTTEQLVEELVQFYLNEEEKE